MKKFILSALAATLVASPLRRRRRRPQPQQRREVTTVRHKRPNGRTVVTKRTVVRTTAVSQLAQGPALRSSPGAATTG